MAGLQLHPRALTVRDASLDLQGVVLDWLQKHEGLTYIEVAQCLTDLQQDNLKYALRQERHPGDPEKKGDEA